MRNLFSQNEKERKISQTNSSFKKILFKNLCKRLELSSKINKLPNNNTIHLKKISRIFIRDEMLCNY